MCTDFGSANLRQEAPLSSFDIKKSSRKKRIYIFGCSYLINRLKTHQGMLYSKIQEAKNCNIKVNIANQTIVLQKKEW